MRYLTLAVVFGIAGYTRGSENRRSKEEEIVHVATEFAAGNIMLEEYIRPAWRHGCVRHVCGLRTYIGRTRWLVPNVPGFRQALISEPKLPWDVSQLDTTAWRQRSDEMPNRHAG